MSGIDARKIEAIRLLLNMFLSTGQYDAAKKTVRALRSILTILEKDNQGTQGQLKAQISKSSTHARAHAQVPFPDYRERLKENITSTLRPGSVSFCAIPDESELVRIEAIVNYFCGEYDLCHALLCRWEKMDEQQVTFAISSSPVELETADEATMDKVMILRSMILLRAKCLYMMGQTDHSRDLLKNSLNWRTYQEIDEVTKASENALQNHKDDNSLMSLYLDTIKLRTSQAGVAARAVISKLTSVVESIRSNGEGRPESKDGTADVSREKSGAGTQSVLNDKAANPAAAKTAAETPEMENQ